MSRFALLKDWARIRCAMTIVFAFALYGIQGYAQSAPECRNVEGRLTEHVTNPSPLQTSGPVIGVLAGVYDFSLGGLTPTGVGAIELFTATSVIHTRGGDLDLAEAGSIDFVTGNIADLWTVVGGTGKWKDATGQMFAVGNFDASTGTGAVRYRGDVCAH